MGPQFTSLNLSRACFIVKYGWKLKRLYYWKKLSIHEFVPRFVSNFLQAYWTTWVRMTWISPRWWGKSLEQLKNTALVRNSYKFIPMKCNDFLSSIHLFHNKKNKTRKMVKKKYNWGKVNFDKYDKSLR